MLHYIVYTIKSYPQVHTHEGLDRYVMFQLNHLFEPGLIRNKYMMRQDQNIIPRSVYKNIVPVGRIIIIYGIW